MEKFNSIVNQLNKENTFNDVIYQGKKYQIQNVDGWDVIKERDVVICIPYLEVHREVVLRKEYIPSFTKVDGHEHHLVAVGGSIEPNETKQEALLRETEEETGLFLRTDYENYQLLTSCFISKSHMNRYHIYVMPLLENDYEILEAKGDGSKYENNSVPVRVHVDYLKNCIFADTVSTLAIELFKKMYLY